MNNTTRLIILFSAFLFCIPTIYAFGMGSDDELERLRIEKSHLQSSLEDCQKVKNEYKKQVEVCSILRNLVSERRFDEAVYLSVNDISFNEKVEERKAVVYSYVTWALIILIGISLLGMVASSFLAVAISGSVIESAIRCLALVCGFLTYFGSKTLGISIPSLLFSSLVLTSPILYLSIGNIIPFFIGFTVSWYMIKRLRKNDNIAIRIALLVGSFILTIFSDLFVNAVVADITNNLLMPNLTFTLGIALYFVFKYEKSHS